VRLLLLKFPSMGDLDWKPALGCIVTLLVVLTTGCGNGGSTSEADTPAKPAKLYPWLKGPTRQFLIRGGDNVVQTYGREGTRAERKQASRTIAAWMRARAAKHWAVDCRYFSRAYVKELTVDAHSVSKGKVKTCAGALAYFGSKASGDLVNNLSGPIDSLRVGSGHGYAQYHGREGSDWVIPVEHENGEWRIARATPVSRTG
jgi:hypothetical protein